MESTLTHAARSCYAAQTLTVEVKGTNQMDDLKNDI
jgi:hypothetical protein